MEYYYDIRYLILPFVPFLRSYSADQTNSSSFVVDELNLIIIFGFSLMFLLATVRIQLYCCSPFSCNRLAQLRFGVSAFSVPLTLSLIATLFLPYFSFWEGYIPIFVLSFWSDAFHSYLTSFEHHLILLHVRYEEETIQHAPEVSVQEGVRMEYYYDIRYLIRPLVPILRSYSDQQLQLCHRRTQLVIIFGLSLMFLLATLRIQLYCCSPFSCNRLAQLHFGVSAFSVPLTLSLIATLFLPYFTFWKGYILIFVLSFWSDDIHSYLTSFEHRLLLFHVRDEEEVIQHAPEVSVQEVTDDHSMV